jgi:hypothetical protein
MTVKDTTEGTRGNNQEANKSGGFDSGAALAQRDRAIAERDQTIATLKAQIAEFGQNPPSNAEANNGGAANTNSTAQQQNGQDPKDVTVGDLKAQLNLLQQQLDNINRQHVNSSVKQTGIDRYLDTNGNFDETFEQWAKSTKVPFSGGRTVSDQLIDHTSAGNFDAIGEIVSVFEQYQNSQLANSPTFGNAATKIAMTPDQKKTAIKIAELEKKRNAAASAGKYADMKRYNDEIAELNASN